MDVIQMKKKKQSLRKHFKSNHNIILMFFTIPEEIKMTNKETKILYYIWKCGYFSEKKIYDLWMQ